MTKRKTPDEIPVIDIEHWTNAGISLHKYETPKDCLYTILLFQYIKEHLYEARKPTEQESKSVFMNDGSPILIVSSKDFCKRFYQKHDEEHIKMFERAADVLSSLQIDFWFTPEDGDIFERHKTIHWEVTRRKTKYTAVGLNTHIFPVLTGIMEEDDCLTLRFVLLHRGFEDLECIWGELPPALKEAIKEDSWKRTQ